MARYARRRSSGPLLAGFGMFVACGHGVAPPREPTRYVVVPTNPKPNIDAPSPTRVAEDGSLVTDEGLPDLDYCEYHCASVVTANDRLLGCSRSEIGYHLRSYLGFNGRDYKFVACRLGRAR
jgi:hypothetical protein